MFDVERLVVTLVGNGEAFFQTLTKAQAVVQGFATATQAAVVKVTAAVGTAVAATARAAASVYTAMVPLVTTVIPTAFAAASSAFAKAAAPAAAAVATAFTTVVTYAGSAATAFATFMTTVPAALISSIGAKATATAAALAGLGKYLGLPMAVMLGISVDAYARFNQAMTQSTSILHGLSIEQRKSMEDLTKNLSTKGVQSATDLAKSYFYLASAGFSAEQSMKVLPVVQQFATAGAFDMAKATSLAADALAALGLKSGTAGEVAGNLTRLTDILVRANVLANANVEQFSTAITSQAGSALKTFHKDAEEGVAVLAAFADQGIKAEIAGNTLSRMLRVLSVSSVENTAEHKRLGLQVFNEQGSMRNLADIVQNLEEVLTPMSDELRTAELKALGFEIRLQQAILPLIGTSQKIREFESELRSAGGETKRVADEQMKSFTNQMKLMWNQINVVAIGVGELLAPAFLLLGQAVSQAAKWFDKLDPVAKTAIVTIGVLTGAIITFFAATILGFKILNVVTGGVPVIMGIIVTGILAAAVAGAVIVDKFGGIGKTLEYIKEQGIAAWEWIKPTRKAIIDFFQVAWFAAHQAFDAIGKFILDVWNNVTNGAEIDWNEVQRIIIKAIIGAEWVLLNLRTTWELMWAYIKYISVAALNYVVKHLNAILVGPATVAILAAFTGNWRKVFSTIQNYAYEAFGFFAEAAKAAWQEAWDYLTGKGDLADKHGKPGKKRPSPKPLNTPIKFTLAGIDIDALDKLEKRMKEEYEKLGASAAESFEKFYQDKLKELALDDVISQAAEDAAGSPDLKKSFGGLGMRAGDEFGKGLSHQLAKVQNVIFGSAEALSRIEEYRAMIGGEYDPKHKGVGGGAGHAHEKKVLDYTLHQGAEANTRKETATEKLLTDIRDILRAGDKRPEVKIEPAGFA